MLIWRHQVENSPWSAQMATNPDFKEPSFPEGFPPKILVYGYFKRNGDWHPRQVDELSLDELEWIPVYEEAVSAAREFFDKQDSFQKNNSFNG